MKIPASTDLKELQQCLQEVWDAINALTTKNIDMHGNRVINAGTALFASDYVTREELDKVKIGIMDIINSL
jgi:hypothetical protein